MPVGYKVVRMCKGQLLSACMYIGALRYAIGETTTHRPYWGPLGVFDTIEHAKAFISENPNLLNIHKIFEVDYIQSEYAYFYTDREFYSYVELPKGTRFADSVKLIREVGTTSTDSLLADVIKEVDNV